MAKRIVSVTTITPTVTADATNLVDSTYPFLLQGGTTTQRNGIWEIYVGGQATSTSSPTYMIGAMDSVAATGTNTRGTGQTDAPMDSLTAPLVNPAVTGNANATTKPQRSSSLHLVNLSLNAYGGASKWQTQDPQGRIMIYGNALNIGEFSLSAYTGGTPGPIGTHMIYEPQ